MSRLDTKHSVNMLGKPRKRRNPPKKTMETKKGNPGKSIKKIKQPRQPTSCQISILAPTKGVFFFRVLFFVSPFDHHIPKTLWQQNEEPIHQDLGW